LEQAFAGYAALPAAPLWFEILHIAPTATLDQVEDAFRTLAKTSHPDTPGGSHDAMSRLTAARAAARKALDAS
jgi:curved DNA-binding protein CbpA